MKFNERLEWLKAQHEALITKKNEPIEGNGVYERYANPILTGDHAPLFWRYDLNEQTNPYLMERFGVHAAFNSGAIKWNGKYVLVVRVEGADRKSFFAVAESPNGVDNFRFWDRPITLPEYGEPATNVYDMRLTAHEDGWIYGIFCVERKDPDAAPGDLSSAVAAAGVARTKDLVNWERLPDMESKSQQRNVVLHPEFVDGKYALYTRPQDGFIDAGNGGGIGWALVDSMEKVVITEEKIINHRFYHTIKERFQEWIPEVRSSSDQQVKCQILRSFCKLLILPQNYVLFLTFQELHQSYSEVPAPQFSRCISLISQQSRHLCNPAL